MAYALTYETGTYEKHIRAKYPFRVMKVGEGFMVESAEDRARAVSSAINYTKTKHGQGKKFRSEARPNGFRVWRAA
jgi:hypothetical protein